MPTPSAVFRTPDSREGAEERRSSAPEVHRECRRDEEVGDSRTMEAVARLAGGMAHHFNNLLTPIIGYSELLLPRVAGDADARRSVEEILEAGERAAVLVRQLLAYSGAQALMPRALDLNAMVRAVGGRLRARWSDGIEIRTGLAGDPGAVTADPDQLERVIVTLAVNARDAMPHGGCLTFATENVRFDAGFVREGVQVSPGEYVMLAVSDTGTGMDDETRERVFEPFRSAKTDSPGLEMAAVYGIVKQSGGYIWAFSRPGRGTTFKIYLPRADRDPDADGPARRRPAALPGADRLPGGGRFSRRIDSRGPGSAAAGGREEP